MKLNQHLKSDHMGFNLKNNLLYLLQDKNVNEEGFNLFFKVYNLENKSSKELFINDSSLFSATYVIDINKNLDTIIFKSKFTDIIIRHNNSSTRKINTIGEDDKNFYDSELKLVLDDSYLVVSYEEHNYIDIYLLCDLTLRKSIYSNFNLTINIPKISISYDNKYMCTFFNDGNNTHSPHSEIIIISLDTFEILKTLELNVLVIDILFKNNSYDLLYLYTPCEEWTGQNSWSIASFDIVSDQKQELYKQSDQINSFGYIDKYRSLVISEFTNGVFLIDEYNHKTKLPLKYNSSNINNLIKISDNQEYLVYYDFSYIEIYKII